MDPVKEQIAIIGRAMLALGFQNTHSGNISVRVGEEMYITKTGSMKGHLEERDICKPGLREPEYGLFQASSETAQHRSVLDYAGSLIHAHSFPVVLMSYLAEAILPLDAQGKRFLGRIPVVCFESPVGSPEMEREIPEILKGAPAMVVKTHGPFVRGATLAEAFFHLCLLDHSASILYDLKRVGHDPSAMQPPSYPEIEAHLLPQGSRGTSDSTLIGQFQRTASDLFYLRLSPFHTGSLSVVDGHEMLISPRLSVPLEMPFDVQRLDMKEEAGTYEERLHRAVYRHSSAKAALFTLSPEAQVLGLLALEEGRDRIIPADAEGSYFYPAVPVALPTMAMEKIVDLATRYKMVVLAGLGVLAIGHTPGHTIHHNSSLKNICRFLIQLSILERTGDIADIEPLLCPRGKSW